MLSCVDCGKEFWGEAYKEHVKCVSEAEKYSGKDWKPKANANKGEQKQELWLQQVQAAITGAPANPRVRGLLERLKDYPNIPRKKIKFENFVKNSLAVRETGLVTQAWDLLSKEISKVSNGNTVSHTAKPCTEQTTGTEPEAAGEETKDATEKRMNKAERKELRRQKQHKKDKKREGKGDAEILKESVPKKQKRKHQTEETAAETERQEREPKRKKKRKMRDIEEDTEENTSQKTDSRVADEEDEEEAGDAAEVAPQGRFVWEAVIVEVLKAAPDQEMSLKKLRKKVLAEFAAQGGDGSSFTEERVLVKLKKKIHKNPRLKVHKERVKLVH